jgi:imidazolonepropionase-like amidohydrolase
VGKVADLVLLTANPVADIRNSSRTEVVVANGRLYRVRRDASGRFVQVVRDP